MATNNNTDLPATTAPSISLNDISFLIQIIEIVAQRGAFKAEEMTQVGAVYDKVKAFVVASSPQAAQQPEEEPNQ